MIASGLHIIGTCRSIADAPENNAELQRIILLRAEEVGREVILADFAALLQGAPRAAAGPTVAPHGLYLAHVRFA